MRRPAESPTVVTLGLIVGVFALQQLAGFVGGERTLFALSNPLLDRPWTLVTSVYAHAGPSHLLANAAALALAGLLLERRTTNARFHGFFVTVGALSGVTQVAMAGLVGSFVPGIPAHVSVLGASGAIFGLFGYLLAANRITETVVGGFELDPRVQLALGGVLAAVITLLTANPGVALLAHFTGLLLGFLAGRAHLLRSADGAPATDPARF
ncbi:rhomboid family intramembrane serine protease [Haloarcula nitratireducens]|uniref:Rhomboid family intramembrane serine protease n=1 Tax=Haloarcula nitratireducens TaxID=2487749 RepID=A0AAW4PFA1_9EURY|nr:rhomboid family intramembrane serine protease [Halomicroarcula nitratireducens]MBX0295985.1 rhomboid family intramembrane serine protease [Halomicroarcula nitratireducens]